MRIQYNRAFLSFILLLGHVSYAETFKHVFSNCVDRTQDGFLYLLPSRDDCSERFLRGEQLVQKSRYTTDPYGRRVVPRFKTRKESGKFVAFLGCSFTFGEGVSDDETLPADVARRMPGTAVYNYGAFGYGPNNILWSLRTRDLRREIPQKNGQFVYIWISDQARRVIGSLSHEFADLSPRYEPDSGGDLVLRGSFRNTQPLRYRLYDWLRAWKLGERLGFNWPPRLSEGDFELIAALFKEIQKTTLKEFPESSVSIVFWPDGDEFAIHSAEEIKKRLSGTSIRIVDYNASPLVGRATLTLPDGHPSEEAYRQMSDRLMQDIFTSAH